MCEAELSSAASSSGHLTLENRRATNNNHATESSTKANTNGAPQLSENEDQQILSAWKRPAVNGECSKNTNLKREFD